MKKKACWYGIRLKSNLEFKALETLKEKGYHVFLPTYEKVSLRRDRKKVLNRPLFSGYIFIHCVLTYEVKLDIFKTRGFFRFLGVDPHKPIAIPDDEIERIKLIVNSGLPIRSTKNLIIGDSVKVLDGPLIGTIGTFLSEDVKKGKLYVNLDFLNRSIEVELEGYMVEKI